jgi:hypothetical protein
MDKATLRSTLYRIRHKSSGEYATGRGGTSEIGRIFGSLSALKLHMKRRTYLSTMYEIVGYDLINPDRTYEIEEL